MSAAGDPVALVPMRNVVLFPHLLLPITVGRSRSIAAVRHALATDTPIGLVLQRDAAVDEPDRAGLHDIGTLARIVQHGDQHDEQIHLICQGLRRVRIGALAGGQLYLAARVEPIDEEAAASTRIEALALQLREKAAEILTLLPGVPAELAHALQSARAPAHLADIVAGLLDAEVAEKQHLLETLDLDARMQLLLRIVARRIEVLRLSLEIRERTREQIASGVSCCASSCARSRRSSARTASTIRTRASSRRRSRAARCRPRSRRTPARSWRACAARPRHRPRTRCCAPGSSG
jgi:ATP-dependent Lon protease